ncbi:Coronin-7, partial [Coemansia helicoidea]
MRLAKVSKFRNAAATVPGREAWYTELPADPGSLPPAASGLAIDASALYLRAASGNALHAVGLSQAGLAGGAPLSALAGRLVDWAAAPCAEDLVAAADDQGGVGVWRAREPLISFSAHAAACASVRFHPTASGALATSAGAGSGQVSLWDISSGTAARFWSAAAEGGAG